VIRSELENGREEEPSESGGFRCKVFRRQGVRDVKPDSFDVGKGERREGLTSMEEEFGERFRKRMQLERVGCSKDADEEKGEVDRSGSNDGQVAFIVRGADGKDRRSGGGRARRVRTEGARADEEGSVAETDRGGVVVYVDPRFGRGRRG
jgi:hypothetical protein